MTFLRKLCNKEKTFKWRLRPFCPPLTPKYSLQDILAYAFSLETPRYSSKSQYHSSFPYFTVIYAKRHDAYSSHTSKISNCCQDSHTDPGVRHGILVHTSTLLLAINYAIIFFCVTPNDSIHKKC